MGEFYEIKEDTDVVVDGVGSLVVDILRGFFACAKGQDIQTSTIVFINLKR